MKGWRTIIANLIAALPILADVIVSLNDEGLGGIIPEAMVPYYTLAVILANVYLRTITSTPLGRAS